MKTFLTILCIFSVAIITVRSLICMQNLKLADQVGQFAPCPNNTNRCVYVKSKKSAVLTIPYNTFFCGTERYCDQSGSMRMLNYDVTSKVTCCSADNCIPTIPILENPNTTRNGLRCPSCYAFNAISCKSTRNVDCVGMQNKCFEMNSNSTYIDGTVTRYAMQGCTSENICHHHLKHYKFPEATVFGLVNCSDPIK